MLGDQQRIPEGMATAQSPQTEQQAPQQQQAQNTASPGVPQMPTGVAGGLSLAEVAGLDMSKVEAKRFSILPVMSGFFEVVEAKLETQDNEDWPLRILITCKVIGVNELVLSDPTQDKTAYAQKMVNDGAMHDERFGISAKDPGAGVGYAKAFMEDAGVAFPPEGTQLAQLLSGMAGLRFPGRIKHRKDRNDAEKVYANLVPEVKKAA